MLELTSTQLNLQHATFEKRQTMELFMDAIKAVYPIVSEDWGILQHVIHTGHKKLQALLYGSDLL